MLVYCYLQNKCSISHYLLSYRSSPLVLRTLRLPTLNTDTCLGQLAVDIFTGVLLMLATFATAFLTVSWSQCRCFKVTLVKVWPGLPGTASLRPPPGPGSTCSRSQTTRSGETLDLYTMGIPLGRFTLQMSVSLILSRCLTTPRSEVPCATHSTVCLHGGRIEDVTKLLTLLWSAARPPPSSRERFWQSGGVILELLPRKYIIVQISQRKSNHVICQFYQNTHNKALAINVTEGSIGVILKTFLVTLRVP